MRTPIEDPLIERARALKLYGLLAHWDEVAQSPWIEPLIGWEESERQQRSLQRRSRVRRTALGWGTWCCRACSMAACSSAPP